ncbi:MAG: response regulator [Sphingobacteriales bacterium JAD_PAG50586_3]|nr:MAG: response regulator [Sphingobacteriales bacterium JAD_PAG50586_3]
MLEKIMANNHTRHIPVIILSGSKDDADLKKCAALGANNYVVKPIEFSTFTNSILMPLLSKEVEAN